MKIPIVIPAYEPDDRFISLIKDFYDENVFIIVVNDGSGPEYNRIFDQIKSLINGKGILLEHERNKGKGRALKTAFKYVIDNISDAIGVVTADSDGQHTKECINTVSISLEQNPDSLVLGVRNFEGENIPWKSKVGNTLTLSVMKILTGLSVSDTQTGLRGIPRSFMEELLDVKGERFEFETRMLIESVDKYNIVEIPIKTIYDSKENHQTHFNPFLDSIKIYKILFERFFKFIFASLSSFVIDILLFTILCKILKPWNAVLYAAVSTAIARVVSATYNYLINYKFVFESKEERIKSLGKYFLLALVQMSCSAVLVSVLIVLFSGINESFLKIIVDTVLFVISYQIQRRFVF